MVIRIIGTTDDGATWLQLLDSPTLASLTSGTWDVWSLQIQLDLIASTIQDTVEWFAVANAARALKDCSGPVTIQRVRVVEGRMPRVLRPGADAGSSGSPPPEPPSP